MINENIELSDEQLAVVAGGKTTFRLTQTARGSLRQHNFSEANTTATLNAGHSKGDISFGVQGASIGQGNIGVVSVSNNA